MAVNSADKVSPGDTWGPPRAEFHNALVDVVNQVKSRVPIRPTQVKYPSPVVEMMVASATRVQAAEVVGFGDPINTTIDESESQFDVIFQKASPIAGRWGVARRGIDPNATGAVVLIGVCWAQVNITDVNHDFAEVALGVLNSASSGSAKILYKPGGTGVLWCCLQLGYSQGGAANITCETIRNEFGYDPSHPTNHDVGTWALVVKDDVCELMEVLVC